MTLAAALNPRSVAVLGASDNAHKPGGRPILFMKQYGFQGVVYPINPNRPEVQGFKGYPSLEALPEVPDAVIVALAGEGAVAAVEQCAQLGVKVAIVLSSGFAEVSTEVGIAGQARMLAAAKAAGMRMLGPNTQGIANFSNGGVLAFSTMFVEVAPGDGPIGVVSQSGGMASVPYAVLRRRGLGVRYAIATGNDADVQAAEMAAEIAKDPDLKLILVYLETIRDEATIAELGRVSRSRGVPVVVLKGGCTDLGQTAAKAHTGAEPNDDREVESMLARHGLMRARNVAGLTGGAELYLKGWTPRGRRVVIVSNSGAACVMAADTVRQTGLEMAKLQPDTLAKLKAILPTFASSVNPIDITAGLLGNSHMFGDILPVIGADPGVDALLIAIPVAGEGYDVPAFARDAAAFAAQTGLPTLVSAHQPDVAAQFAAAGLPTYTFDAEAITVLAQFIQHHELIAKVSADALVTAR